MQKKVVCTLFLLTLLSLFVGCTSSDALVDGYYTAETAEPTNGWKEFVSITVRQGTIVAVEYNAKNDSGFIKSWDIAYMHAMFSRQGTYPNEYTRYYAGQLLGDQDAESIDAISGASRSAGFFEGLSNAVIEKARNGDETIAIV